MAELDPQPVEPIVETKPETVVVEPVVETTPDTAVVVEHKTPTRPRKVYSGLWGPAEIVVVAAGVLSLVAVFAFYMLGVVPSNRELARNKAEAERLDAELMSANSKYGDIRDTSTQVDKIVGSVDDFETRFLPVQSVGQAALYQRLNGLINAYGLVNTTGPDYQPLDAADITKPGQQPTEDEKGRAKFRSLYPGVYVATTVEGTYQNLRRFIREIESGREFVVISTIELAPSDSEATKPEGGAAQASTGQPAIGKPGQPVVPGIAPVAQAQPEKAKGKMHGETVALHIEMAAYFRRPNSAPAVQQYQQ
jgi:hypothetical protein